MDNNQFKPEEYGVEENFLNEIIALKNQNADKYIPIHIQQHSKLLADLIIANAKPRSDVYIFAEHFPHIFFAQAIEKCQGKVKLLIEHCDVNLNEFKKRGKLEIRKLPAKIVGNFPFFFISGSAFTFQTDTEGASAVANFNNRKDAKILKENFISMWDKSEKVTVDLRNKR